jgi:prepilin-type N-terminal cleavage/methylation domain-containing protein
MNLVSNRRSFTLIEVLISITIFSIIIIFLYEALEITKKSNKFLSDKLSYAQNLNYLQEIIHDDLAKSTQIKIIEDRNRNTIVQLKTSNSYHNSFYKYVLYFMYEGKELVRVESRSEANLKESIKEDFIDNSYVDVVDSSIGKFVVTKQPNNSFVIFIKKDNQEKMFIANKF